MTEDQQKEFYGRLKEKLEETSEWPSLYLYKFIIPSSEEKVKEITGYFDNIGAVIESRKSKKGTYTSLSITVKMESPDAVIAKYKKVTTVEGVISL